MSKQQPQRPTTPKPTPSRPTPPPRPTPVPDPPAKIEEGEERGIGRPPRR